MKLKALPSLERLNELFDYNPETGQFINKTSCCRRKEGTIATYEINGYRALWIDDQQYYAHRIAYYMFHGIDPQQVSDRGSQLIIDHINSNRADNRISNLQLITFSQNVRKAEREALIHHNGINLANGIHKYNKLFKVSISIMSKSGNKTLVQMYFPTVEEAHALKLCQLYYEDGNHFMENIKMSEKHKNRISELINDEDTCKSTSVKFLGFNNPSDDYQYNTSIQHFKRIFS